MKDPRENPYTGWWRGRPKRPRWVYWLGVCIVSGSALGVLFLVPVAHAATAQYVVLLAVPSNVTIPSCQGAVFYQVGTFHFTWLIPGGTPLSLTIQNSNGGLILYNQSTLGEGTGSVKVDGAATYYVFCLKSVAPAIGPVGSGLQSVAEVAGGLDYDYSAPIL